jgi:hypothetical protein
MHIVRHINESDSTAYSQLYKYDTSQPKAGKVNLKIPLKNERNNIHSVK